MRRSPLGILGIGAVTPVGRDLSVIAERILSSFGAGKEGGGASDASNGNRTNSASEPLTVADDLLADPATSKRLRRADRFTRMAVLAAMDACRHGATAMQEVAMERIGLIITTGFGPYGRGFKFLDGILDCGDDAALPTDFSHSVHGTAAAYISEILGLRGPSLSITDFVSGFEQGVLLAQCWLEQNTCDRVLIGAVEELGQVLLHCASRMLPDQPSLTPGEGAVFFLLGPSTMPGGASLTVSPAPHQVDLLLIDEPVLGRPSPSTTAIGARIKSSFNPHFGCHPSSVAFQILSGLLAMRSPQAGVDNVATFRPSCDPSAASLFLSRT